MDFLRGLLRGVDQLDPRLLTRWLSLLALGDFIFIAINLGLRQAMRMDWIVQAPDFLLVTSDHSLPEIYDYAKWALIVVALVAVYVRTRAAIYLAFAGTFVLILLDDSLQLHEVIGAQMAAASPFADIMGMRMQDFGELAVWACFGVAIIGALLTGFRSASEPHRTLSLPLLYVFIGLVGAAVGLDFLHSLVEHVVGGRLSYVIGLIEDGGEMLLASAGCAYAVALGVNFEAGRRWVMSRTA